MKFRDAQNQLKKFLDFANSSEIINSSLDSMFKSAEIYAVLRKKGIIVDDIDILIAGICIANDLTLVTNNEKHYNSIEGLKIENWSL